MCWSTAKKCQSLCWPPLSWQARGYQVAVLPLVASLSTWLKRRQMRASRQSRFKVRRSLLWARIKESKLGSWARSMTYRIKLTSSKKRKKTRRMTMAIHRKLMRKVVMTWPLSRSKSTILIAIRVRQASEEWKAHSPRWTCQEEDHSTKRVSNWDQVDVWSQRSHLPVSKKSRMATKACLQA